LYYQFFFLDAVADISILTGEDEECFQFQRIGYFCIENGSGKRSREGCIKGKEGNKLILNRTVPLKKA
jgi:hypothetical protein